MKTFLEIIGGVGFLYVVGIIFNHISPWAGIIAFVAGLILIFNYLKKRR